MANGASVTDVAQVEEMVKQTMDAYGRIDILINNAGILRDKSFSKVTDEDFRMVLEVHLNGNSELYKGSLGNHERTKLRQNCCDFIV